MALHPCLMLLMATTVLVMQAPQESMAKRFDCRLFCRETGFHGVLGGCRCSFTLFTSKRSDRIPQIDTANIPRILPGLLSQYRFNIGSEIKPTSSQQFRYDANVIPTPAMDERRVNGAKTSPQGYTNGMTAKRREFEMDLDNGDVSDYLRLPY